MIGLAEFDVIKKLEEKSKQFGKCFGPRTFRPGQVLSARKLRPGVRVVSVVSGFQPKLVTVQFTYKVAGKTKIRLLTDDGFQYEVSAADYSLEPFSLEPFIKQKLWSQWNYFLYA